jgi:hypothetical protein
MDLFGLIVFGSLVAVLLALLALGRFSARRSTDITNKDVNETLGARAAIEDRDIGEMVDGQNVYRQRRGRPAVTEEQVRRRVGSEQLGRLDRADAEAKAQGR